jgi:acyl-CoA thioester hydrolase
MSLEYRLRVYYEDTDAGGIVYYANYLKFIERARTEALLAAGMSQTGLRARLGVVFAVREVTVSYLAPARLEDELTVRTRIAPPGGSRLDMEQEVWRGETCLARARVTLVCVGSEGRATRIPAEVREALGRLAAA